MNLNDALEGIRKRLSKHSDLKLNIIKIINEVSGVSLTVNEIDTKKEIIYLKTSPIIRSQIIIKKDEILKNISSSFGLVFLNII